MIPTWVATLAFCLSLCAVYQTVYGEEVITNHWSVKFKHPVNHKQAHAIAKRNGFNMIRPVRCDFNASDELANMLHNTIMKYVYLQLPKYL